MSGDEHEPLLRLLTEDRPGLIWEDLMIWPRDWMTALSTGWSG